jgi:hypothetical protein
MRPMAAARAKILSAKALAVSMLAQDNTRVTPPWSGEAWWSGVLIPAKPDIYLLDVGSGAQRYHGRNPREYDVRVPLSGS